MGIVVAETLGSVLGYAYTDPDAFLTCDNPACDSAWLTRTGLVAWETAHDAPSCARFADRLLVACGPACLAAAREASGLLRR